LKTFTSKQSAISYPRLRNHSSSLCALFRDNLVILYLSFRSSQVCNI